MIPYKVYTQFNMNSNKITNLGSPVDPGDAATRGYVDAVAQGLIVKESVRVATTADLAATYNAGVLTADADGSINTAGIDGITNLAVGNRILVKNQEAGQEKYNGIYEITDLGDAENPYVLTRTSDFDSSAEVVAGVFTFVSEGTANADSGWVVSTNDPITLDTTSIAFTQFSGAGQVGDGAGLTKEGNTINIGAGDGITVNTDSITVKLDGSTLTKSSSGLKVTDSTFSLVGHDHSGVYSPVGHDHSGVYEPADSDIQTHITNTDGNPHGTDKTDIGLGNVTNDAQVKKISSSTDNAIVRWDSTTGDTPQDSLVTIDDNGSVNIPSGQSYKINGTALAKGDVGLGNVTNDAQVKKISSSTDNAVVRWDSTTGDTPQDSLVTINDSGTVNIPSGQSYKINGTALTYTDVGAAASGHDHSGVYEPADSDIQTHITNTDGNPHGTDKTDIGLGNVTNDAQVKKISSSTDNAIVRWDSTTGDTPQDSLVTIDDSGSVNIPTGQTYKINGTALAKGDVGLGNVTNDAQIPLSVVEDENDFIVATASATVTNKTPTEVKAILDVSKVADHANNGSITVDGSEVTVYAHPTVSYSTSSFGDGELTSFVITHSLGTRNVQVSVYESASPYNEVIVGIQKTSTSTITIDFGAYAPASGEFTVAVNA